MLTKREAKREGQRAGRNAAAWVFDGNTSDETYRRFVDDPESFSIETPPWLSGEWAGESMNEILGECANARDEQRQDEVAQTYEDAASDAFWAELQRIAYAQAGRKLPVPDAAYTSDEFQGVALNIIERRSNGMVCVVMVGDNRPYWREWKMLRRLSAKAFCRDCGQVGCTHNVYELIANLSRECIVP